MAHSLWLTRFIDLYSQLNTTNLASLKQVYHTDVHFLDPMHEVRGRDQLLAYFDHLYQQLTECHFVIEHALQQDQQAAIYWRMRFIHNKLNRQRPITVQGHSQLTAADEKVIFHRDYLDLGAMLYEHIPLLGGVVKRIKHRASKR